MIKMMNWIFGIGKQSFLNNAFNIMTADLSVGFYLVCDQLHTFCKISLLSMQFISIVYCLVNSQEYGAY